MGIGERAMTAVPQGELDWRTPSTSYPRIDGMRAPAVRPVPASAPTGGIGDHHVDAGRLAGTTHIVFDILDAEHVTVRKAGRRYCAKNVVSRQGSGVGSLAIFALYPTTVRSSAPVAGELSNRICQ